MPKFTTEEIARATGASVSGGNGTTFADVTTDTRTIEKGALFIALKGERFNGEDFLKEAQEAGAAGVLVSNACGEEKTEGLTLSVFRVPDPLRAYQQIAHAHGRLETIDGVAEQPDAPAQLRGELISPYGTEAVDGFTDAIETRGTFLSVGVAGNVFCDTHTVLHS